jgi:hypothetical protein
MAKALPKIAAMEKGKETWAIPISYIHQIPTETTVEKSNSILT